MDASATLALNATAATSSTASPTPTVSAAPACALSACPVVRSRPASSTDLVEMPSSKRQRVVLVVDLTVEDDEVLDIPPKSRRLPKDVLLHILEFKPSRKQQAWLDIAWAKMQLWYFKEQYNTLQTIYGSHRYPPLDGPCAWNDNEGDLMEENNACISVLNQCLDEWLWNSSNLPFRCGDHRMCPHHDETRWRDLHRPEYVYSPESYPPDKIPNWDYMQQHAAKEIAKLHYFEERARAEGLI